MEVRFVDVWRACHPHSTAKQGYTYDPKTNPLAALNSPPGKVSLSKRCDRIMVSVMYAGCTRYHGSLKRVATTDLYPHFYRPLPLPPLALPKDTLNWVAASECQFVRHQTDVTTI